MKILVVGAPARFDECHRKFADHDLRHVQSHAEASTLINDCDVAFDFMIDRHPEQFPMYAAKPLPVFLNTVTATLSSFTDAWHGQLKCTPFGFNGFPTLFNREYLEVSIRRNEDTPQLENLCKALRTQFLIVDDRVGMVTPRVICMIINEAFYTVQEKTGTRQDIDLAMKLGTNYPYGPFEWCERIGIEHVYRLLDALHRHTHDERYKISDLMSKEYRKIEDEGFDLPR